MNCSGSLGHQHPDWQQMILSVFQAVSDLLIEVLGKEFNFLTSLMTDTPQQAGQVNGFFSDLMRHLGGQVEPDRGVIPAARRGLACACAGSRYRFLV
ncbi:hypothetical protein [Nocardia sp. NPDC057455]|uniref:hypothetical protein n=1 Tax=Nocardia sp. NPDC057455 TaxID=3346138 RepID=UPI00366ED052